MAGSTELQSRLSQVDILAFLLRPTIWYVTQIVDATEMCDNGPLPQKRFQLQVKAALFNPLHPNISRHILPTFFYTFPMVLTRRICLTIKIFFSWWSFPLFLWP